MRPNIIFIMVDDMGYGDLSSYGQTNYETPQIDLLINQGVKFTNAYSAAAVCSPTRVALMTGLYPARNEIGLWEPLTGLRKDSVLGLPSEIRTLSSLLKKEGYKTALFGKWHLGTHSEFSPNKHGFDYFFGITAGSADYIDHRYFDDSQALFENNKPIEKEGYLTDLITDYTVDFLKEDHQSPFFINLQFTAPHSPWQVPGDAPYPLGKSGADFNVGGSSEIYRGMIKNLDANIGRVLNAVKEMGLEKSTMIIFTSDNGGVKFGDMGPFKGFKGQLWEGGIRVPAAIKWPSIIPEGQQSEQMTITMDWTVTILKAAKVELPSDILFDGINILPYCKNSNETVPREFYWRVSNFRYQNAYRKGAFKYLKTAQGEFLFDLEKDPGEINNLKNTNSKMFKLLKSEFQQINSEMLEPLVLINNK